MKERALAGGGAPAASGPSFQDIKAELNFRVRDLVRELAPGGSYSQGYYIARNPARDDRNPGSFWIRVSAPIGAWKDEATGDQGDVVDLVTYCKGLASRQDTYQWCLAWLGWAKGIDRQALEARRKVHAERARVEQQRRTEQMAKNETHAFSWWLSAKPIEGTAGETYLASRGVVLADLKHKPKALRFFVSSKHVDKAERVTFWPAIASAMCNANGAIVAVHRTFLRPDGSGKAPVDPQKKIWPHFKGAMIRLARGASKLSPEEAARKGVSGPLVVTEGIEDGLSVALACPELRVWAAGTLGNMGNVPKLACMSRLILCADNDTHPQATGGLDRALAELRRAGHRVDVARSWLGKDVNDLLRGKE